MVWSVYFLLLASTSAIFIISAIYRIYHPQVWDFTCFYLYGKVVSSGYNYYSPENFQTVFNAITIPFQPEELGGFINEVVNVGFPYPPPTILYFIPLGYFSYETALAVWTFFNLIMVAACLFLLYDQFFKAYKLNGAILLGILFFSFSPALSTISFSQTNFILLFLLLLMKKYQDKPIGGLILVLAIFTKPYMVIFGLYFLFRSKWKAILYGILSALSILGLTTIFVGKEPLISYIIDNPSHRIPSAMFLEETNQSLHSMLLRNNLISLDNPWIFMFLAVGIMLLTLFYLFFLAKRKQHDHIWAVLLLVGLLLYPGTLYYYGTLLLFIVLQFFDENKQMGFNPFISIPILGIFYFLSTFTIFSTICFLLIVIVLQSILCKIHPKLEFSEIHKLA